MDKPKMQYQAVSEIKRCHSAKELNIAIKRYFYNFIGEIHYGKYHGDIVHHVLNQQNGILNPPQQYQWQTMVEQSFQSPQSQAKLKLVLQKLINCNYVEYDPITIQAYQKQFDPKQTKLATKSHNITDIQFSILDLLNVIENKLVKLIQTNFYG